MGILTTLRASKMELATHITLLIQLLKNQALSATVYSLPLWDEDDLGKEPTEIEVDPYSGEVAITKALDHYLDFAVDPEQPGVFAKRLAGTLSVTCSQDVEKEIRDRVAIINELKNQFEKLILSISPKRNIRFEAFKDALPLISKLALVRNLTIAAQGVQSITYSWTHRPVGGVYTRDELLKELANARKTLPRGTTMPEQWQTTLDIEEKALMRYGPAAVFAERRTTRVTAMAKLKFSKQHKPIQTTAHTHSPILVINDQPKIGLLRNYVAKDTRASVERGYPLVLERRSIFLLSESGELPGQSRRKVKQKRVEPAGT